VVDQLGESGRGQERVLGDLGHVVARAVGQDAQHPPGVRRVAHRVEDGPHPPGQQALGTGQQQ
jgi:hypothetical protein